MSGNLATAKGEGNLPALGQVPPAWREALGDVLSAPESAALANWIAAEEAAGRVVYPPRACRFRALELTPPEAVRVVILGQDPYHGPGQAQGLAFSVPEGVPVPPSLRNIYKELAADCGGVPPGHGNLESWARQGVLLLNTVLTVEAGKAGSHQKRGWEAITDAVVAHVAAKTDPCVFLLWGSHAQKKIEAVGDLVKGRHLVLEAPHPSPLSAHRGFLGCGHFGKANAFLVAQGRAPVDWALPPAEGLLL